MPVGNIMPINILIAVVLIGVAASDLYRRVIPNVAIFMLLVFGSMQAYLQNGMLGLLMGSLSFMLVLCICLTVGWYYLSKKGIDAAGGGDYKLIAAYSLVFGLSGLLLCLMLELVLEIIYRYLLFPERKREAVPMGASFSIFGILLLVMKTPVG